MGALSLTRENALVFVAVMLVWASRSTAALGRAGSRPSSSPAWRSCWCRWPLRNYAVGGGFYLTTSQFGSNFYIGNNPATDGTYMALRSGRGAPEYERQDATELAEHAVGRTLTPAEVSAYWTTCVRLHHHAARLTLG